MRQNLLLIFLCISFVSVGQNSRETENLEAFTKLYGYIKYFHPSDEAAALDWDNFAIYGSAKVLNAKNDAGLIDTLLQLFKPVAPTLLIFDKNHPQTFELKSITPPGLSGYKNVYWFHKGVGLSAKSVYSSVRLNRSAYTAVSYDKFMPVFKTISAEQLRGKTVKLVGRFKSNVDHVDNGGSLWIRVDKNSGMGFFKSMSDRLINTNQWKEYEISGTIDKDARDVAYGCLLKGAGKLWVNDITLFVKNDTTGNWEIVKDEQATFGNAGTAIFPKDWAAGNTQAQNDYHITNTLTDQLPALQIASTPQNDKVVTNIDYTEIPKFGTLVQKDITHTIQIIFPLVLYGNMKHTYPQSDSVQLNNLKTNIKYFCSNINSGDNKYLRLGDVVITWNIFKHFFPYWQDAGTKPEELLTETLHNAFADQDKYGFKETLQSMTAPLNDGHIYVTMENDIQYTFPFSISFAEGEVVVEKVFDSSVGNIKSGDIIEKIDNIPCSDLIAKRNKFSSGSPQLKRSNLNLILTGNIFQPSTFLISRNGDTITNSFVRSITRYDQYQYLEKSRKKSGEIANGIYYLDLDKLPADSIETWANKLKDAKGIICDLRGYPNGNHNLINHLLTKPEDTKWMFIPETAYPDEENIEWLGEGWNMQPKSPHFNGKVVFITDGRAISYAESYMGFVKDFKLATIVGQPTAGTNGNINPFTLPGGYSISWTGMLVKNLDGSKHHLIGIVPDIPVERTIEGIKEGKDELLDRAIEIASR